jgi:hypothetical protein
LQPECGDCHNGAERQRKAQVGFFVAGFSSPIRMARRSRAVAIPATEGHRRADDFHHSVVLFNTPFNKILR